MTADEAPDNFDQHIKQQILEAFGYASEAELNATIEEQLPGYLTAHAEWEAEKTTFTAELQGRLEDARQAVATFLRDRGMLPDGVELEVEPMDLQADAQWMASEPPQFIGMLAALDGEYVPPPRCASTFADTSEPRNVLADIDAAIKDWELGPDVMRYSGEGADG